jgi:hypothetical protein
VCLQVQQRAKHSTFGASRQLAFFHNNYRVVVVSVKEMVSHSILVLYDSVTFWDWAKCCIMIIWHADRVCVTVGGEIRWCVRLDVRIHFNSMFEMFVSFETVCLDGGMTNVAFNVLSFTFTVSGCCSVAHATSVGGRANSCY